MEGTLGRTKKLVAYFGGSFCKDKVAITLILLILSTLGVFIYALTLPKLPSTDDDSSSDSSSSTTLFFVGASTATLTEAAGLLEQEA